MYKHILININGYTFNIGDRFMATSSRGYKGTIVKWDDGTWSVGVVWDHARGAGTLWYKLSLNMQWIPIDKVRSSCVKRITNIKKGC